MLWAFAVVQPLLDVLSGDATLFIARGVDGWSFVLALLAVAFLPPVLMLGVEQMAGLVSARGAQGAHLALVACLSALVALDVWERVFPNAEWLPLALGAAAGLIAAAAYSWITPVRTFLSVLAPAPVAFIALFLFTPPADGLISPSNDLSEANAGSARGPVVFLIFDELPISSLMDGHGEIDSRRFPNFARLAHESDWYRNTVTAADTTPEAVPAILTGRRPQHGVLPTLSEHPQNLFTWLGGTHHINAMEHATRLCSSSICDYTTPALQRIRSVVSAMSLVYLHTVGPPTFRRRLPPIGRTWGEALASDDPAGRPDDDAEAPEVSRYGDVEFERFLGSIRAVAKGGRPPLHFLHSSLPHAPWRYLPSGTAYDEVQAALPGENNKDLSRLSRDQGQVQQRLQRHLLQTIFADRLLGRLMRRLRRVGLYDDATVALVADHGISFVPGGEWRAVNPRNHADVGMVPFFLKRSRQTRGREIDEPIQTIDVLPAIAAGLGTRLPWVTDGKARRDLPPGGRRIATILRRLGEGRHKTSMRALQRGRQRTLSRQGRLFGSGSADIGLFAVGGGRGLLGRRASDLVPARARRLEVELDRPDRYDSVDTRSRFIPALVRGRLTSTDQPAATKVAIVLNGRVQGVGPTYVAGGERRFSVVSRERGFRQGRNTVSVLGISASGGQ